MLTTALSLCCSVLASTSARPVICVLDPVKGLLVRLCTVALFIVVHRKKRARLAPPFSKRDHGAYGHLGMAVSLRRFSFQLRGHGHWARLASSNMNALEVRTGVAQGVRMLSFGLALVDTYIRASTPQRPDLVTWKRYWWRT